MEAEKGLSHLKSLNHRTSPLVLFFCTGGLCVGVWWKRRRSMNRLDGETRKRRPVKMRTARTTYWRVFWDGAFGLGYARDTEDLRRYRDGAGLILDCQPDGRYGGPHSRWSGIPAHAKEQEGSDAENMHMRAVPSVWLHCCLMGCDIGYMGLMWQLTHQSCWSTNQLTKLVFQLYYLR